MFRVITAAVAALFLASPSSASPRLLVVSKEKRALQVLDAGTGQIQFEVAAPGEPHEVVASPDGRFAYLADFEGLKNVVSVVDLEEKAIVASIDMAPIYKPHGLALTRDGTRLYVTCEGSKAVGEIDTAARKVTRTFRLHEELTHTLALSRDEKIVYAASSAGGNVAVINLDKGEFERSILSGQGCEALAVSPGGSELWVVNRVAQTLAVIDAVAKKRVHIMACEGNPMRISFTPDGKQVVVTCAIDGKLALFDPVARTESGRVAVGQFPIVLVFDETGANAYVTNSRGNDVAVLDMAAGKVTKRFAVGGNPEGIAYLK